MKTFFIIKATKEITQALKETTDNHATLVKNIKIRIQNPDMLKNYNDTPYKNIPSCKIREVIKDCRYCRFQKDCVGRNSLAWKIQYAIVDMYELSTETQRIKAAKTALAFAKKLHSKFQKFYEKLTSETRKENENV